MIDRQIIDTHAVDPRRTFVALHSRQPFLQVLTLESTALRPPGVRDWLSPHMLRPLGQRPSGLHPRSGAQVQFDLILQPHRSHEITALLASSTIQAFSGAPPSTMRSADFCAPVRPPCDDLSLVTET
jgi:hypothetical protein